MADTAFSKHKGSPSSSPKRLWTLTTGADSAQMREVHQLCLPSRGTVSLVQNIHFGEKSSGTFEMARYVLKEIPLQSHSDTVKKLDEKWTLLKNLRHENVVRYTHVEVSPQSLTKPAQLIVLMEWCQDFKCLTDVSDVTDKIPVFWNTEVLRYLLAD
ncbi:uncharacterized protein LOC129584265 [Paramacrobiotus metropolitanus]|uniref:uncharacterized protein LOC129584265 n=1 Tax=Paramacrobiotus metropolitanus TaxID=2943436 RepID=UPI002445B8A7|nr:uncharacterized protein LOC129584265 [Paramacrobiotus metropolitanus]